MIFWVPPCGPTGNKKIIKRKPPTQSKWFKSVAMSYGGIYEPCIKRYRVVSALPIFPGGCPPSIFGTFELNYRVRDGNGWTLKVINTDYAVM